MQYITRSGDLIGDRRCFGKLGLTSASSSNPAFGKFVTMEIDGHEEEQI
jgi:hypothetical protein